jgi:nucleotide-binding universal stress UspA family protein
MYRTLLVATDGSPRADKALKAAVRMARGSAARLYVINVQPRYVTAAAPFGEVAALQVTKGEFDRATQAAARRILERAQRFARGKGVRCRVLAETSGSVARAVVRSARRLRADLIVMASHGRGRVAGALLGRTTQQVLAACHIPVLGHR